MLSRARGATGTGLGEHFRRATGVPPARLCSARRTRRGPPKPVVNTRPPEEVAVTDTLFYEPREVVRRPTTARVARSLERYLEEPLYIDCEYLRHYTERH